MMKKFIISLTLLFLTFFGFSQGVIVRTPGTNTVEDMRLMAGLNFYVPVYPDTTTANLTANKGIDSAGALIFCRDINGFRIRRSNPKRWDYVTDSAVFSTITALKDSAAVLRALITSSTVGAGGNNTDIQFNKSGTFAGNDSLQYDGTNLLVGFNKNVALKKGDYLYFNGVDTTWRIQLITTSGSDHIITGNELRLTIPTTSEGFSINNGSGVPSFQVQGNSGLVYVKGNLQVGAVQYPNTDGVNGQILTTNGTGTVSFQTPAATGITALTGDVAASGTGSVVTTLATVNSSPNTFGDSTKTLVVTVNAKGLVTSVVSKSILISQSQILNPDITGLIAGGTNIALSGSGTSGSPYVINSTAPGTGTVTSITVGAALTGGTITTSGTIGADTSVLTTKTALIDSLANYVKAPVPNSSLQHSAVFLVPSNGITVGSSNTLTLGNTVAIGLDSTKVPTTTALIDTAAAIRSAIGSGGITSLTGDVTASGTGSVAATLATVNSNVGSFTNASITVNGKGLVTAASSGAAGTDTTQLFGYGLKSSTSLKVKNTIVDSSIIEPIVKAQRDSTTLQNAIALRELLSNKTATASTSTTTYPNWLGVENYVASIPTGTDTTINITNVTPSITGKVKTFTIPYSAITGNKIVAGTNITVSHNTDSSYTVNATGSGTDTTIIAGSGITQSLSGKSKTLKVDTSLIATKSYVNQQDTIINAGAYLTQTYSAGIKSINADTTSARLATQTQLATKQTTLVNGYGTTISGGDSVNINTTIFPAPTTFGTKYQRYGLADNLDFGTPNGTMTLVQGSMFLTSTSPDTSFNDYSVLRNDLASLLDDKADSISFKISVQGSTAAYATIGYNCPNGTGSFIKVNISSNANSGALYVYGTSGGFIAQLPSSIVLHLNDSVNLAYNYNDTTLYVILKDLTTKTSLLDSIKGLYGATPQKPGLGNAVVGVEGNGTSTIQIYSAAIYSTSILNPNLLIMGTSKEATSNSSAGSWSGVYTYLLKNQYPYTEAYCSNGLTVASVIAGTTVNGEAISLNGQQCLFGGGFGCNDIRNGTAITTLISYLNQLAAPIIAGGGKVYVGVFPEDSTGGGVGLTAFKNYLAAGAVVGATYIDYWTRMSTGNKLNANLNSGDGVHGNTYYNFVADSLTVASGLIQQYNTAKVSSFTVPIRNGTVPYIFQEGKNLLISTPTQPTVLQSFGTQGAYAWYNTSGSISSGGHITDNGSQVSITEQITATSIVQANSGFYSIAGYHWNSSTVSGPNYDALLTGTHTINWGLHSAIAANYSAIMDSNVVALRNTYSFSAIPTIVAGTGAGTSPTVSISANSTNTTGAINITTGTLPTLSGIIATITFSNGFTFPHGCHVQLDPENTLTATLLGTGATTPFTNGTTTTFVITANTTALAAATAYVFGYTVSGN